MKQDGQTIQISLPCILFNWLRWPRRPKNPSCLGKKPKKHLTRWKRLLLYHHSNLLTGAANAHRLLRHTCMLPCGQETILLGEEAEEVHCQMSETTFTSPVIRSQLYSQPTETSLPYIHGSKLPRRSKNLFSWSRSPRSIWPDLRIDFHTFSALHTTHTDFFAIHTCHQ